MKANDYLDRKIETASAKETASLQPALLARQLDYLFARSEFYQEKCRAAGIRRKDFRKLADLARFPMRGGRGETRLAASRHCRAAVDGASPVSSASLLFFVWGQI
jgi:hypothetical protein